MDLLLGRVESRPDAVLQLGLAQYQSGDLDGALATLEPAAAALLARLQAGQPAGEYPTALLIEYGRFLVLGGRHAEALPYLETATKVVPDRKQGWQQLGQALAAVGRRDEARAALDQFQSIVQNEVPGSLRNIRLKGGFEDPVDRELRRAYLLMLQDQGAEALEIVQREARLAPEDPRPRLLEARIYLAQEDFDAAAAAAEALVAGLPGNADALYIRGTTRMARQDMEGAESDLRNALELHPEHTAALNDLAVLLMDTDRGQEARGLLERALEIRPDDTLARENLNKLDAGGSG